MTLPILDQTTAPEGYEWVWEIRWVPCPILRCDQFPGDSIVANWGLVIHPSQVKVLRPVAP